jgi:hypothetical protein
MGTMRKSGANSSGGRMRTGLCGAGAALLLCGAPAASNAGEVFYTDWVTPGNTNFADDQIWTVNLDGSGKTAITTPGQVQRPIGLAVDMANQYVYYAAGGAGAPGVVGRVHFNGTGNQTLVDGAAFGFSDAQHIKLDLANGKMYWASYHDGLRRANLDGSNVEVVEARDTDATPPVPADGETRGQLALFGNTLYIGSPNTQNMYQANAQANTSLTDMGWDTVGANDLAINTAGTRLYWADANGQRIMSNNLAGTDVQTLVSALNTPLGVALLPDGKILWTERGGQRVGIANADGSNPLTVTTAGNPFGVAVAVPEPGTAGVLVLVGGALLAGRRRRRAES